MGDLVETLSRRRGVGAALSAILAVLPYLHTLGYDFVFDDPVFIEKNRSVREMQPIGRYFTDPATLSSNTAYIHQIYRPLRTVVFASLHALFGVTPFPYHLINLLLHAGCTLLLFSIGIVLLDPKRAVVAAAIFAVHPAHAEAVTWISSLADLMSTFFVLLALRLFMTANVVSQVVSVAVVLPAALLSKEMAITLPVLLLLTRFLPQAKSAKWHGLKWGLVVGAFVIALVYFFWRASVLGQVGQMPLGLSGCIDALGQIHLIVFEYLRMLMSPHPLCSLRAEIVPETTSLARHIIAGLSLLGLVLIIAYGIRKNTASAVLAAAFLITLTPVLHFIPVVIDVAERFVYLPSCFFCLSVADGLRWIKRKIPRKGLANGAVYLVVAVFGLRLALYNLTWKSPLSVALEQTRCEPADPNAYWNLGNALVRLKRWKEAEVAYERLLAADASQVRVLNSLSYISLQQKAFAQAEVLARKGIAIDPENRIAHNNLGAALVGQGRHQEAAAVFEWIVARWPDDYLGCLNLGISLRALGREQEARVYFERAERLGAEDGSGRQLQK